MAAIPTVKVKNPGGTEIIINEDDFDPKKHEKINPPKRGRGRPAKSPPYPGNTP